jgi:hypothetical protein
MFLIRWAATTILFPPVSEKANPLSLRAQRSNPLRALVQYLQEIVSLRSQ